MENFSTLKEREVRKGYDVHVMRHYTTLAGLSGILHKGYLEARESKGDNDWGDLVQSKEVVSFLDPRYDSELKNLIWANDNDETLDGRTMHLALHMAKIAVMIETNLDEMEEPVELLTTMVRDANRVSKSWNRAFSKVKEDLEYANGMLEELFPKEVTEKALWTDEEIKEWNDKVRACKWCKEGYKVNEITYHKGDVDWLTGWDMFRTDYDATEIGEDGYKVYKRKWNWHPWQGYQQIKDECENFLNSGIKELTEEEQKELQDYVDSSNVRGVFKFLRRKGVPLEYFKDRWKYNRDHKPNAWNMIEGLDSLIEAIRKLLMDNSWVDIELRVPQNIKLTPNNCRIHIFADVHMNDTDKGRIQKIIDYNAKKKQPLDIRVIHKGETPELLG